MHAFLVTPEDSSEVESLIQKGNFQRLDFEIKTIEDCRNIIHHSFLSQQSPTAFVIKGLDSASVEAQNAFLKSLEEPQKNIIYILSAHSEQSLLPTIVSRCQVIRKIVDSEILSNQQDDFIEMKIQEKFLIISKIKKREEAEEFVSKILLNLHKKLLKNANLLYQTQIAYLTLKSLRANGNINIHLTNFVSKFI